MFSPCFGDDLRGNAGCGRNAKQETCFCLVALVEVYITAVIGALNEKIRLLKKTYIYISCVSLLVKDILLVTFLGWIIPCTLTFGTC